MTAERVTVSLPPELLRDAREAIAAGAAPSLSAFVPAPGFPLPVYATNDLPEYPPSGTIVFWSNLAANVVVSIFAATLCWGTARLVVLVAATTKHA